MLTKRIILLLPAILIFSLLINSALFVNSIYTNLFLYLIIGSFIIVTSGFLLFRKAAPKISFNTTLILGIALLWLSYIVVNDTYINPDATRLKSMLLMISIALFIALVFYLNNLKETTKYLFLFFTIVAGIEAVWCILQFLNSFSSPGSNVLVKGSWANPNITAIFLALIMPYIIVNAIAGDKANRKWFAAILLLVSIAVLLLKCRTAMIGASIAIICILEWHYGKAKSFFKKAGKLQVIAVSIFAIVVLGLSGLVAYNLKKGSADGRKLIWSLSLNMTFQKPLFGYGYGSFERNYNIEQANYFQNFSGDEGEVVNASYTLTAYNEFIENTVEGGIVGGTFLLVFVLLLFIAGHKFLKAKQNAADKILVVSSLAGIAAMFFMSFINFTITAIPVMCIFIFYAAVIGNLSFNTGRSFNIPVLPKRLIAISLIIFGTFFCYKNGIAAYTQSKIQTAVTAAKQKDFARALDILKIIPVQNQAVENYHQALGNILFATDNESEALAIYQKATLYYSSPELYQQIGNCLFADQKYAEAIKNYEIAKYIQPNRFTPRYLLMRLYVELKDKANAIRLANEITVMEEKIPSAETALYKKSAKEVLNKLTKK